MLMLIFKHTNIYLIQLTFFNLLNYSNTPDFFKYIKWNSMSALHLPVQGPLATRKKYTSYRISGLDQRGSHL